MALSDALRVGSIFGMKLPEWRVTHILLKFQPLKEFLPDLRGRYVDELLPNVRSNREIDEFLHSMSALTSLTTYLQAEDLTISDFLDLFHKIIDDFRNM